MRRATSAAGFSAIAEKKPGWSRPKRISQGPQDWLCDPGRSPYQTALDQETHALIESALSQVSPNYRAAVVLREVEGLSYEEISEVLEISLGTVKSRILRGRESLRKHLTDRLGATPQTEWPLELGTNCRDARRYFSQRSGAV